MAISLQEDKPIDKQKTISVANEPEINYENKIFELLKTGEYTVKYILKKLQLDWTEKKLRDFLKSQKEVEMIHKKPLRFTMKNQIEKPKTLFD